MTTVDMFNTKCKRCDKITPKDRKFRVVWHAKDSHNVLSKFVNVVCEACYMELTDGNRKLLEVD